MNNRVQSNYQKVHKYHRNIAASLRNRFQKHYMRKAFMFLMVSSFHIMQHAPPTKSVTSCLFFDFQIEKKKEPVVSSEETQAMK